jgi:porin
MNAALVNGPVAFLPSYDLGGAAQWELGNWSAAAVYMSMAENDAAESYRFMGIQAGYTLETGLGQGNYRLMLTTTTEDFSGTDGVADEALTGIMISCDQQLGDILGAWVRIGWQDDDARVDHRNLFSGGIDATGATWGRAEDNIGLGVAYLGGGKGDIDHSSVIELYYRLVFNEIAALTIDFQCLIDDYETGDDPKGLVSGVRFVASF